jgi:tetratricopeptide (TPR) repeat protein/predicted Ser/Thr protein kinase
MVELAALAASGDEPRDRTLQPGDRFGRYTIVELVGAGGMGSVWIAHDPDLRRRVALKVLRGDHHDEPRQRRLLREAQAAARLRHPNVVPVYDVGAIDGRVFMVMELVDGLPLDAWRREGTRSRADIVEMFAAVGRGLAAAHAAGLTHRDIKPANILVGRDGRPRITDFGLAALAPDTQPTPGEDTGSLDHLTRTGAIVGTPRFMAPEQWRGERTDARSDQFSFCVAFWEALHDQPPFRGDTFDALSSSVCAGAIQRPSARVPPRLHRVLLRGLATDPRARHPSMDALLDALARAQRPRRGWMLVASTIGITAAVAIAVLPARADVPHCESAAEAIGDAWSDARLTELRARAGTAIDDPMWLRAEQGFSQWVDAWSTTWDDACEAVRSRREPPSAFATTRSCLEYRRLRLGETLDDLLVADAIAPHVAIEAWAMLPSPQRCLDTPTLAVAFPDHDPARNPLYEEVQAALAEAAHLDEQGRLDESFARAEPAYTRAVELEHAQLTAAAALRIGYLCARLGRSECARERLGEAYFLGRSTGADDLALDAALQLVYFESNLGHVDAGETWVEHARALVEVADMPIASFKLQSAIGSLRFGQGRYEDAASTFEIAAQQAETVLGENHPHTTGALENRATTLRNLGRLDEASEIYARTVASHRATFGLDHPTTLVSLDNLGGLLDERGEVEASVAVLREGLAAAERVFGPEHVRVAGFLANLGIALGKLHQHDEATRSLERALAIFEAHPPSARERVEVLGSLGNLAKQRGRRKEAEVWLERALVLAREHLGADHPHTTAIADELVQP